MSEELLRFGDVRILVRARGGGRGASAPGGFDGFFRELSEADAAGTLGPEVYASASEKYGIAWL